MGFWDAWEKVKDKIDILLNLKQYVKDLGMRAVWLKREAKRAGNLEAMQEAEAVHAWTDKWYPVAVKISAKTKKYYKEWKRVTETTPKGVEPQTTDTNFGELGILPIFSAAVIATIVSVAAYETFQLIREGKFQSDALELVAKKVISPTEFSKIISSTKGESIGTGISQVIKSGGIGVGTALATPFLAIAGTILAIMLFSRGKRGKK